MSGDSDIDNFVVDSLILKWSDIFFNINRFCDNVILVENFICDVFKDDFIIDESEFSENDNDNEDKKVVK